MPARLHGNKLVAERPTMSLGLKSTLVMSKIHVSGNVSSWSGTVVPQMGLSILARCRSVIFEATSDRGTQPRHGKPVF